MGVGDCCAFRFVALQEHEECRHDRFAVDVFHRRFGEFRHVGIDNFGIGVKEEDPQRNGGAECRPAARLLGRPEG